MCYLGENKVILTKLAQESCSTTRPFKPESWDVVDESNTFLLNSRMYEFCKADEELPVHLKINTSEELRALFENEMFVVATAGVSE